MATRLLLIVFSILFISSSALARNWDRIKIPGAKCGNGSDYHVWVDLKSPRKLAIELMGGGACWSKETCLGRKLRAWVFPVYKLPFVSVFASENSKISPAHDGSMIYFPYCTGDVHVGTHTANYDGTTIHHWGYRNVSLGLQYLKDKDIIDFDQVDHLLVYGASAGALGAMAHSRLMETMVPLHTKKTLIADSPGMHFGPNFWNKFSSEMFQDIKDAYSELVQIKKGEGNLAPFLPQLCRRRGNWNIGILQASQDVVMSRVFGEISAQDHEQLVYGNLGVFNMSKQTKNCSVFAPRGPWHTFLLTAPTALVSAGEITAGQFVFEVASGSSRESYRSN